MNNLDVENDTLYLDENLETHEVYWKQQYEALERLKANKDFQTVILQGYITNRALDDVSLLGAYSTISAGTRPDIMESLVAISRLQDYFRVITNIGGPSPSDNFDEGN